MSGPQIPSGGFYNGLPQEAQRKILRDFQTLAEAIKETATIFDAVVDPTIVANSPSTHEYLTVGAAVASEEVLRGRTTLTIGVSYTATTIKESLNANIGSGGTYFIVGFGGTDLNHRGAKWDWNGATFIDNGGTACSLFIRGVYILSTTAMTRQLARAVGS